MGWWWCFPLYRWRSKKSMWNNMLNEKDDTLIMKVKTRRSMDLVGLQDQVVSINSQYVRNTFIVWFCFWSEWSVPVWWTKDEGLRSIAYLDPSDVKYDWQLKSSDCRFINIPFVTYKMNSLMNSCMEVLNTQYSICWSSKKYCDKLWKFDSEYC